jgi:phosphohistidine swiveling domain-containing protein
MAYIERQEKGGKTYHYLSKSMRQGDKFRKTRILLSNKRIPIARLKGLARKKEKELEEKCSSSLDKETYFSAKPLIEIKDEHIVWERPGHPYFVEYAALAVVSPLKLEFGDCWGKTHGFFQNGMVKFVWSSRQLIKPGIRIINNLLKKDYLEKKKRKWNLLTKNLVRQFETNKDLKGLSDRRLIQRYDEFGKVFLKWWGFGQVAECISYGSEHLLKGKIDEKAMNIITTPSEKSYSTIEEEELIRFGIKVMEDKKLRALFAKDPEIIAYELKKFPNFYDMIKEHERKYYWLLNNYSDVAYCDTKYFIVQIRNFITEGSDLKRTLKVLGQRFNSIRNERNKLIKELELTDKYKKLIRLVDYFTIFQDKRKAISIEAHHYLNEFLKELSKRTGISKPLLTFSLPTEYSDILTGKFDVSELIRRKKGCVMIVSDLGIEMLKGRDYEKLFFRFFTLKNKENTTEIEGRRAEGGKVTGKVKVVLDPRNSSDFKPGDVLVTTMTSPDFLEIMKKARAIITDEGGITSHAAIVSRELGVPCVVGTKIATQALKDGDLVDVNANHGIVKIIRK